MKAPAALLLTLALVPGAATAGEIYGTIREGGKPLAAGARVTVACGGKNSTVDTDKNGSYRLFAAEEGKCTLTVNVGGESPSVEIHSYADSARYNLVVEKKGGKRALRTE